MILIVESATVPQTMAMSLQRISGILQNVKKWYQSRNSFIKSVAKVAGISTILLIGDRIYRHLSRKYNKYPPGLFGIPYFGSLFTFVYYDEWNLAVNILPHYGPITMHNMGNTKTITIHDYNIAKTMLESSHCNSRPWILLPCMAAIIY